MSSHINLTRPEWDRENPVHAIGHMVTHPDTIHMHCCFNCSERIGLDAFNMLSPLADHDIKYLTTYHKLGGLTLDVVIVFRRLTYFSPFWCHLFLHFLLHRAHPARIIPGNTHRDVRHIETSSPGDGLHCTRCYSTHNHADFTLYPADTSMLQRVRSTWLW